MEVNNQGMIAGESRVTVDDSTYTHAGKRNDSQEHGFLARPEDVVGQHPPVAVDDTASTAVDTLTVRINLTHALDTDLTAQLVSSTGIILPITGNIYADDYAHEYVVSVPAGLLLDGTWTLQVTDHSKNRMRGSLIEWTMIVEPVPIELASSPASAVDQALLSWLEPDSSDDDGSDILTERTYR